MGRLSIVLILSAVLAGCAGSPFKNSSIAKDNRDNMLELTIGQSKEQVLLIMGNPFNTESYLMDGEPLEFWLYITRGKGSSSLNDDSLTPLAFRGGILQGWGRNYYDRVIRVQADIAVEQK